MRLAWFRPDPPDPANPADDTGLLIATLRRHHRVEHIDATRAHDVVWMHARQSYDLFVYELDNTHAHQFVWPYLVHYPGVTLLRRLTLRDSRSDAHRHRGSRTMVRVPLLSSRVVVVPHATVAETLSADYPDARIRHITPGVQEPPNSQLPTANSQIANRNEVVVALEWPAAGSPLTKALAGFAAARAVIVFDTPETADWPSLDPQNWQPRGPLPFDGAQSMLVEPICVSIDPRDEAHSLRLAIRRLSQDAALRERIGTAAHAWWCAHATPVAAASRFEAVIEEARHLAPPCKPADWPAYLTDDGTGRAREILMQFGIGDVGLGDWELGVGS